MTLLWQVVDDLGSVEVFTLTAPEPQTIVLTPVMSVCELRSEVARCFGVPPEQQRFALQGGGAGAEGGGGLVGEGAAPSAMVWGAGVRAGMRLLLVTMDSPVADDGVWSIFTVVNLRHE